jgi:hypothetical protein
VTDYQAEAVLPPSLSVDVQQQAFSVTAQVQTFSVEVQAAQYQTSTALAEPPSVTVQAQPFEVVASKQGALEVEMPVITGPPGPEGPEGPTGPQGSAGGTYRHIQGSALETWTITHNLGFFPNVTVVDSTGHEIWPGDVTYTSMTTLVLTFSSAVGGEAYLS